MKYKVYKNKVNYKIYYFHTYKCFPYNDTGRSIWHHVFPDFIRSVEETNLLELKNGT